MTGGFFLSKLDISKNTLTQIPALYELVSGWLILTSVLTGLIEEPTRITPHSSTLLDLIMTKCQCF